MTDKPRRCRFCDAILISTEQSVCLNCHEETERLRKGCGYACLLILVVLAIVYALLIA